MLNNFQGGEWCFQRGAHRQAGPLHRDDPRHPSRDGHLGRRARGAGRRAAGSDAAYIDRDGAAEREWWQAPTQDAGARAFGGRLGPSLPTSEAACRRSAACSHPSSSRVASRFAGVASVVAVHSAGGQPIAQRYRFPPQSANHVDFQKPNTWSRRTRARGQAALFVVAVCESRGSSHVRRHQMY